jgi:Holliday junction resolvasome RuvABC endonuclease subunit
VTAADLIARALELLATGAAAHPLQALEVASERDGGAVAEALELLDSLTPEVPVPESRTHPTVPPRFLQWADGVRVRSECPDTPEERLVFDYGPPRARGEVLWVMRQALRAPGRPGPVTVLGVDPGLACLGLATVELGAGGPCVRQLRVVRTQPSQKKRRLRAGDDLSDRVRTLATALHVRLQELPGLVAIGCEAQALPFRGGRMQVRPSAIAALGRVRGLLDAFSVSRQVPVLEETAQELKRLATGRRDASKVEVMDALCERFPEARGMLPVQSSLQEHAADALAAAVAALESDAVRAALRVTTARGAP